MSSDTESLSPSNFSNEEDEATQSVQSRRALSIDLADHDLLEVSEITSYILVLISLRF